MPYSAFDRCTGRSAAVQGLPECFESRLYLVEIFVRQTDIVENAGLECTGAELARDCQGLAMRLERFLPVAEPGVNRADAVQQRTYSAALAEIAGELEGLQVGGQRFREPA